MDSVLIHESLEEFNIGIENNYLKKAIWSDVGDHIISASEDNIIRIYTLPFETFYTIWHNKDLKQIKPCILSSPLRIKEQNHIYDITTFNEGGIGGKDFVLSSCKSAPVRLINGVDSLVGYEITETNKILSS